MQVSRKRKGFTSQHDKSLEKFFNAVATAFVRHINLDVVKCVIIASPGFLREQFLDYLLKHYDKEGIKGIEAHRSKIVLVHSSSGFKHALKEVLADPSIASRLTETKVCGVRLCATMVLFSGTGRD